MEPPKGFWASLWSFLYFLPFFIGLLLLGVIKGIIFCPLICLIMAFGNSAVILGLWPAHSLYTYYCIVRANFLGPVLKLVLCLCISILLISWPLIGIVGSILAGAGYGFLAPLIATFQAVGEGRTNEFIHCIIDGTWSTVEGSFTVVRDFTDYCFHSYFSYMDELRQKEPPSGKTYEIRLLPIPGAILAGVLGVMVDVPMITLIALVKSPYMLFKGWHRLFHDLIGREGPFLETICVPFAGLAILLWPLAVVGAVSGSVVSSIFLGAYAAIVCYQESSFWFGLCYIVSSLAVYDEYSNDLLDLPEGSCFHRLKYRRQDLLSAAPSAAFSRPNSFRNPPSRLASFTNTMLDLNPLELLDRLFKECERHGEVMVTEGVIKIEDVEDAKSSKGGGRIISIGLPAYCILQALLRSANANAEGILLILTDVGDNVTEITPKNRPKDAFFDWFLDPLLIIKDQIKAENLSEAEQKFLSKLVLLSGDPKILNSCSFGSPPESEHKRAELDAMARRLQGITKSISRYPTFRRRFTCLVKTLAEKLAKKNGSGPTLRTKSGLARMFSQKSFKRKTSIQESDKEAQAVAQMEIEIK